MKYYYNWKLSETDFAKNKGKVFSCFACGDGSTMGYKLAGFDVIGFNEIDPRMANLYIKNHQPKYQFIEAIQDFVCWDEYPEELYHLDILDGSPPCTSFSMTGKRQANWGVEKFFKEGQKKQVLDTLFFDFIALAEKLQPKIVLLFNLLLTGGQGVARFTRRRTSKYYGHHRTTFIKNKRTGEISHEMNFTRMDSKGMYLRNNLAFLLGDVEVFQIDTYRYIFPLCKRFRYNKSSQSYPAYNRGVTPFEWQRNRKLIKERLIKFISELE